MQQSNITNDFTWLLLQATPRNLADRAVGEKIRYAGENEEHHAVKRIAGDNN